MTTIAKRTRPAAKKAAAKSVAERVAAYRERQAKLRVAEVRSIFAHVDDHPEIKKRAAVVIRRRERQK